MAQLTVTEITGKLPLGDRVLQVLQVTTGSAAASDEYIKYGFSNVEAAIPLGPYGTSNGGVAASVPLVFSATDPSDGDTVTLDGIVYTLRTTLGPIAATATITFSATDQTDEDVITIDGILYYLQSGTLDNVGGYDVLLSGTENTMAANFAAAVNNSGVAGTNYGTNAAAHPAVKASVASNVVTLTARVPGTAGNSITLTKTSTNTSISGATLTGGRDVAANEVLISGTEATMATGFAAAVNRTGTPGTQYSQQTAAHPTLKAAVSTATVTLTARVPGTAGNAITVSESGSGQAFTGGATALSGGVDAAGATVNFVLNALGTAAAANSTRGALGIEASAASQTLKFIVLGRP